MMLYPIETSYRGFRFRSRLEARWAVFLAAAGIEFGYEVEGFNLAGRYYLPDFWLPQAKAFLEIKPKPTSTERLEVIDQLAPVLKALTNAADAEVFLLLGSPSPEYWNPDGPPPDKPDIVGFAPMSGVCSARLFECPFCRQIAFRRMPGSSWTMRCACRGDAEFDDADYNPYELSPRIRHAMTEARRARFEHGEDGVPRPYGHTWNR